MKADQNELITRVGPGTPCGQLMRHYWQPVALLDEFDPQIDPRMRERPLKAVRVLGQDLVLFRVRLRGFCGGTTGAGAGAGVIGGGGTIGTG